MAKKSNVSPNTDLRQMIIRILEWTGAVLFILLAIFMLVAGVGSLFGLGRTTLDMSEYVSIQYSGFNERGFAELNVDKAAIENAMQQGYEKNERGFLHLFKRNSVDDYKEFTHSIEASLDKDENLKNEDIINVITEYNEDLAAKIGVKIENKEIPVTVTDLKDGRYLTDEELFKDLKFSIEGISPVIAVKIKNVSEDEFIKTVNFSIVDEKSCYQNGDIIEIDAIVDEDAALQANVDLENSTHRKEFKIDGFESYVNSVDQIPQDVLEQAVEEGKTYFGDALEYGLRIFTEAGLYPDFSKGYEFSDPELLSGYVEVITDPSQTSVSKPYNYLELCYNVYLSQPGGKGCMAEAIVCFSNLKIDTNGNCELDLSTGKLFSASHNDSSIKKSLNEWFGKDYNVEKFEKLPE